MGEPPEHYDGPDYEWDNLATLLILDDNLDHRVQVDECPKCAAIIRTENRQRHERVCWYG